tara:strand:+ start:103 stop:606 length:504 start_codon:yes stop_codon:yes gene_type:complete
MFYNTYCEVLPKVVPMLSEKEVNGLPYIDHLRFIHKTLKKRVEGFPYKVCAAGTRTVHEVEGLMEIAGEHITYFHPFINQEMRRDIILENVSWHAWNFDPKRELFVDITGRQYFYELPDIIVMPVSDVVLKPDYHTTMQMRNLDTNLTAQPQDVRQIIRDIKRDLAA